MAKIVEIKKMWHQERGRKMPIMFLDCGHGFVHTGNQEVGEAIFCTKCAEENRQRWSGHSKEMR